jgi:hypothetical protein
MPKRRQDKEAPENKRIFRCWVEMRELKTGSVRELPLNSVRKIYIPRKKNDPGKPDEDVLELIDGLESLEAKNLDDLAAQLRQRYPDAAYERRLFTVRDREAEKRRAQAMEGLMQIIAEAAVEELLRESAAQGPSHESQLSGPTTPSR